MANSHSSEALPSQPALSAIARIEWQTIALAVVIYGGFLMVTWCWQSLPVIAVIVCGGWLIAWQGSLQHEVIHGHPSRHRGINDAMGWPPLSLWLPYAIYREGHLTHHRDEYLTDPIEDPESSYFTRAAWERMGRVGKTIATWNLTLLGRLTLGPLVMIVSFLGQEFSLVLRGDRQRMMLWVRHAAGVAAVLFWVLWICAMPLWLYLIGFIYFGAALTRLRSYTEHRYADHHYERTAIVENSPLFGLLFLYNNLHVLHHQWPGIPWYRIPSLYRRYRNQLISLNGGLVYDGYRDIARRFLLKQHDSPSHPLHRLGFEPIAAVTESPSGGHRTNAAVIADGEQISA
ncbi:fatty acid desaturase (plasmid) [Rhizobium sp. CB3171]|uniref:fatty acid desaturase n=1 Tax=Rhizobium sp. CB3171 TaxID=3039157 RepID=UPI0024B0B7D6|nr:fatty acid desaturase [Rhizobium sp. CB3171]WFU05197.1 fatty acid desaturase [Rhizobium sp. CB3171]